MTTTDQRPQADTAARILDTAERLVQRRGFNGFSYADVAAELEITKASLHYHFPSKSTLGEALIVRYDERFAAALDVIDADPGAASAKLLAYADLYANVLEDQRMCLCGMLAAEYQTLPDAMQRAVTAFFEHNEEWLARVLQQGRRRRELDFAGPARELARAIVSALEGALLTSRPYSDPGRFQATARRLIATLTAAGYAVSPRPRRP